MDRERMLTPDEELAFQDTLKSVEVRVENISIEGAVHTRLDFLTKELSGVQSARTFVQLGEETSKALRALRGLGIYRYADIVYDISRQNGPVNAIVQLQEKNRLFGRVGVTRSAQSGEQQVSVSGTIRNVLGAGETLEASLATGDLDSANFNANFRKPRVGENNYTVDAGIFSSTRSTYSSFVAAERGVRLSVFDPLSKHRVHYEGAWRDAKPFPRVEWDATTKQKLKLLPSASVLALSTPSVKSSVIYEFANNQLDDEANPSSGEAYKASVELAGLGGDVRFIKGDFTAKAFRPINSELSWGLSFRGGFVRPWSTLPLFRSLGAHDSTQVPLVDRFVLGGGLTVRGFDMHSLGPRDKGDALGGETFWAASACLSWLPPHKMFQENNVRALAFLNAGNLVSQEEKDVTKLWREGRVSAGVGLALPTSLGRIELNAAVPLVRLEDDVPHRFSFSVGMDFL